MDLNAIHLTISVTTLALILGMIWKSSAWVKSVNMRLQYLGKSHKRLYIIQSKMKEDINKRHEANVETNNANKLAMQELENRVSQVEDKCDSLVAGQDDVLLALNKISKGC